MNEPVQPLLKTKPISPEEMDMVEEYKRKTGLTTEPMKAAEALRRYQSAYWQMVDALNRVQAAVEPVAGNAIPKGLMVKRFKAAVEAGRDVRCVVTLPDTTWNLEAMHELERKEGFDCLNKPSVVQALDGDGAVTKERSLTVTSW